MSTDTCTACAFQIDDDDNFCRRCGRPLEDGANEQRLPAHRTHSTSLTIWRPQASPVVKGAAVMAAGTIGQFVVRRAISTLIGGDGRKRRSLFPKKRTDDGLVDEAQIITETVMMRRVRIRRPT